MDEHQFKGLTNSATTNLTLTQSKTKLNTLQSKLPVRGDWVHSQRKKKSMGLQSCRLLGTLSWCMLQPGSCRQTSKIPRSSKNTLNSSTTYNGEAQNHVCNTWNTKAPARKWQWTSFWLKQICWDCHHRGIPSPLCHPESFMKFGK